MTGPARVRWRDGASGNLLGYVGTLPSWAFQIFQSGDPAEGRKMIAQLPGMSGTVARDPDVDVLKGEAEGWLVGFVASVGAAFRDTTPPGQASDSCDWDEPDEPEPSPWDPGDEADDQGGASEHRYLITEDDRGDRITAEDVTFPSDIGPSTPLDDWNWRAPMTPKPPTPQGISALLKRAGFERATETKSRNQYSNTAGFHVRERAGAVLVNHWSDSDEFPTAAAREAAHGVLTRYAEVIVAAGWSVEDRMRMLVVTAGKPSEPVRPHPEEETGR